MSIENMITLNSHIIYAAILFFIALLLMGCHNWILSAEKVNPFKRSVIELTVLKKWMLYTTLLMGTVSLMFWVAPALQFILDGLIAIFITPILSFFMLYTFKALLSTLREDKLSLKLLVNQDFLLTAYLIILTELSFLNWFKEFTTYVQTQFLVFVLLYSLLIIVIGIGLGIPQKNGGNKRLPEGWRLKSVIISIIILDPIIVVVWTSFLVQITLEIILSIQ